MAAGRLHKKRDEMNKKVKSMVLYEPYKMEMREFDYPQVNDGDMVVKVDLVSICGGDPIEFEGRNVKTYYPLILGHEMVGTVDQIGETASKIYGVVEGDKVTVEPYIVCGTCDYCLNSNYQLCENSRAYGVNISSDTPPHIWGAYGEYMYIAPGSKVHKIEPGVKDEAAVLSSVLGNGVRWIRTKGKVKFGETVIITGVGAQGLATIVAANEANAGKIVVLGKEDLDLKWELAKEYGATHLVDLAEDENPLETVREITNGKMGDVVVECTGAPHLVEMGLDLVKPAGRYILVSTCGFNKVPLTTDKIVFKEIELLGGLGQSWDTEPAVDIINSQKYRIDKMVTQTFPLEKADEAMHFFMESRGQALRVAIKP
jgi:threonine dehydrogenase-like Zn-dependent dehydrogenase